MSPVAQIADAERRFRVHLTNIVGTGAVQLVASLLPALEHVLGYRLEQIYLPDRGEMADYRRVTDGPAPTRYQRVLPNALSRVFECLMPARRLGGPTPLLVLGDLPIRCHSPQVVFVQTSHLTRGNRSGSRFGGLKYCVARAVFRLNLHWAAAFLVQTEAMRGALVETYPQLRGKVRVVQQPVPVWVMASGLRRTGRRGNPNDALTLVYPAAAYPHKNFGLLSRVGDDADAWPVKTLRLTIPPAANPNRRVGWIDCVGLLAPPAMVAAYYEADALLFLSIAESYGLPLVEAMWIGLPIVCPDLPYAHSLCGDQAIYFKPDDIASLRNALEELRARLRQGWWPNWSTRLASIPKDWDTVASAMLSVLFAPNDERASSR